MLLRWILASLTMLSLLAGCGGGRSDPTLQVDVLVNGVAVSGSPLRSGTTTIAMSSGQSLSLQGNLDITVVDSLGAASGSPVTRTANTWTATLNTPQATTATLLVTSRDYPDLSATLQVNLTPAALGVDVLVDGAVVNVAPVGDGEELAIAIRSGQTVALKSSVKADFSVDLGSARTSQRIATANVWQSLLTSAVATEVVLVTTPQGDDSRHNTIRVTITPTPLSVDVLVNSVASNPAPILAGETYTVRLSSSQSLTLNSSISMVVDETLNGATKSSYTKSATSWSSKLSGAAASTLTLVVRSSADSTLFATILVQLDPTPLQVSVKIAGTSVTDTPLQDGQTGAYTVQSGQTVVISSPTLRIDVNEALNGAQVGGRTNTPTAWGGALATSSTTDVVLTVLPQGDATRSVTVKLHVLPTPLQLTVTAGGNILNAGNPVLAGQSLAVPLTSGSSLVIDSSVNITVTETLNSATRSNYTKTANHYAATFTAASGSEVVLSVVSAADPTLVGTLKVSVAPQVYSSTIPRSVNEYSQFKTTNDTVDKTHVEQTYNNTVQTLLGAGSFTSLSMSGNVANATLTQDINGNVLARKSETTGVSCTYTPVQELLSFPLYVGKYSDTAAWSSSCSNGVSESATAQASVLAVESVTIAGRTMDALKVQINVSVFNSNDPNLQGGDSGTASYNQYWNCKWAIPIQRTVYCERATSYVGPAPGGYTAWFTETMTQYSKP